MTLHTIRPTPVITDYVSGEKCVRLAVDPVHDWAPVLALSAPSAVALDGWEKACWMSEADLQQLQGYAYDRRRRDVLSGRRAAYLAVAMQFPELSRTQYRIENGVFDQPIWAGQGTGPVALSISHAKGLAVAIASPGGFPMGVDIELITDSYMQTLANQMTGSEQKLLHAVFPTQKALGLVLLWCAKEAISKALRCGLTCPMTLLEVDEVKPMANCQGWTGTFNNFYQYRFHAWCPAPDRMLALVMDRRCSLSPPAELMA